MEQPSNEATSWHEARQTVLCYGDSNTWGSVPMYSTVDVRRFNTATRWTMRLARSLGDSWLVVEEGLSGRTTDLPDPMEGAHKNGATHLLTCLQSHAPVDRLVILLGTNDLKARFARDAEAIACGVRNLVSIAIESGTLVGGAASILVVCPPPILETGPFAEMFAGGAATSAELGSAFVEAMAPLGVQFLLASRYLESSATDGIHLDTNAHAALAVAVQDALTASLPGRFSTEAPFVSPPV